MVELRHFEPHEFVSQGGAGRYDWWPYMDGELLRIVDDYREALGYPIHISPVHGAIGRHAGRATTRHNVDRYGAVHALDMFPSVIEPERWVAVARGVGITGFGFYPDWQPNPGIHIDNRGPRYGRMATWGAVRDTPHSRQRYTTLRHALHKWGVPWYKEGGAA